ncbi:endoplasmic reticulum-resident kdel protein [Aspergillus pseudonomiae]|uniref:Endoplasmic reticulum-resident kdel protein n=1 Tax=Aspergillus pseudonomiae TaxID=1506151 RepID=A0A5N6IAG0_9EURO|nr:endoplasmic reticulum-resident kdel protein [Aspergillus pseudonomiae]KAB8262073.1 endoplasmic reticulum-resident kdel protein [Aspergillus pseudonomiae]KAE8402651.1 endoplasmic reticulum-resident kdel protein [Aspergillus pseudonomiae]
MGRLMRPTAIQIVILALAAVLGVSIWSLWLGVNSDRDNIHPLLNHLIPAGHCACQTSTIFKCGNCLQCPVQPFHDTTSSSFAPPARSAFDPSEYSYNDTQCTNLFPGLFEDPLRAQLFWTARHGISRADVENIKMVDGMARVAVYQGRLYVHRALAKGEDHRRKILGILGSIHRALISAPHTIPDTEIIFSIEDKLADVAGPDHPLWVLARKATEESVWLMPDFGFWSWGHIDSRIGPYDEVVKHVEKNELPWDEKEDKLVWRGKLSFAPKLRRTLLEIARKYAWGDVKEVEWKNKANYLSMEKHCDYRYIAHVEGRSYSASLKYRQACRSVVVIHKLQYIQHHHYLLVSSGPQQNFVQVERDWADLPHRIQELLDDPLKARMIADNNVKVFRERYLTPAADACYWRALLQEWATASPEITETMTDPTSAPNRGIRFESFLLLDPNSMMRFGA